jgi:signal transduction histidine kinase/CheY-like chemotaxis protein
VFSRTASGKCPPQPADGFRKEPHALTVTRAIAVGKERLGTLSVSADIPSFRVVVNQYLHGSLLVVLLSLLVSVGLAILLQSRVSAPILVIAGVARQIARTHRFGKRVEVSSGDEVGALAASFNFMLDEIEKRDTELAVHREQLEREVAERSRVNAELHVAKERAEIAARLKAEFLANMSHEIRTPLNGVSGMIALALADSTEGEVRSQLTMAQTAAMSLTAIVNDILDFSKVEAGKMTLETVDFSLRRMLDECLQLFRIAAAEKEIPLRATLDNGCPEWLHGDPVRVRQILVNLVGNAVKFTASGYVHVHVARTASGHIQFEVADTGIGIPEEKLGNIFQPFTQADGSHTRKFGGTGLGLAITQRLVELMNGSMSAESQVARGSRFFVTLPLQAGCEPAAGEPIPSDNTDDRRLDVLVAEDNVINQKVIRGFLKRRNWKVTIVNDGQGALSTFRARQFDVILMDVQMPGIDGLEATRLIREEERQRGLPRIPIIALTAHALRSQHDECLASGMDAVLTKPLDPAALLRHVRTLVPVREASQAAGR